MEIQKLVGVDYEKPFKSNEIQSRGKDEASIFVDKINEMIDVLNWQGEWIKKFLGDGELKDKND